jgi:hypothetical protein
MVWRYLVRIKCLVAELLAEGVAKLAFGVAAQLLSGGLVFDGASTTIVEIPAGLTVSMSYVDSTLVMMLLVVHLVVRQQMVGWCAKCWQ